MAIDPACFAAAKEAAAGKLSDKEVEEAFERIVDYQKRSMAAGDLAGGTEKLRRFTASEAERTRIAAAMQRRHAAMNVLVRDRLDAAISGYIKAGMTPKKALLTVLEGSQKGVENARSSVGAMTGSYEARYTGAMLAEIQASRPHLISLLDDKALDADILREMYELRDGGQPGITRNDDAKYMAKVFSNYAELSRGDLNRLGASIGKLDGWAGSQTHDDIRMIAAGKDAWISSVLPKLDLERTFPDVFSKQDLQEALAGIFDTITTGIPNKATPRERGQRVNPANLAKSLGKSRVLHFKDPGAALAYRDEFGFGTTVSGMVAHLRNAARMAGNMEVLGPNPELMYGSMVDGIRRQIKESDMAPADKEKALKGLQFDAGTLRDAFDISSGLMTRPVNVTAAKIGADIRAVQSLAKLGGAVFSSVTDNVTVGLASQFRGSGFFKGFTAQVSSIFKGRPKGEVAEISFLLGEGFDGIVGQIASPQAAVDGPVGRMAGLQETFFKWNGLSWWTDIQRASAGRIISSEMGMRAKSAFDELPAAYKHVLGLHGIGKKHWEAIRQAGFREVNGTTYVTPERMRDLPDEAVSGLSRSADDARRDLELKLGAFFADETSYGVVETDARSRRTTTWGTRPGTMAGESIRFVMQFKGFPIAFTQRVVGRAVFGFRKDAGLSQVAHIGTLLAGMTMAGYVAMTMKDAMKGYWPPRDPTDPKTWGAAFIQGGAAGIYGDFLFGRVNRFGGGLAETAMGPALGAAFDAGDLILKARDATISSEEEVKLADWLDFATQNTPFINLFYTRPVLDYLFLSSMKEAVSPGFTKRQERNRKNLYGQERMPFLPKSQQPFQ